MLVQLFLIVTALLPASSIKAQTPKIHLFTITPEWDKKTFCGASGYNLTPINAPSFSYSGGKVDEAQYSYTWEQKIDNGIWIVVSSEKNAHFVPSFDPPVLFNMEAGAPAIVYSWRLRVSDEANGKEVVESDIYSVTLVSAQAAVYKISTSKGTFGIDLTMKGGASARKYEWSVPEGKGTIPSSQLHHEDPLGLSSGIYQVKVSDGVCPDFIQQISTSKSSSEKIN